MQPRVAPIPTPPRTHQPALATLKPDAALRTPQLRRSNTRAQRLGLTDAAGVVSAAFGSAAGDAAQTILVSLKDNLVKLAQILAENPGDWGENSIQLALDHLGSPCGSHRNVLDKLRDDLQAGRFGHE